MKTNYRKEPKHPIQVRLPEVVFGALQVRAEAENRSLSSMANILLAEMLVQSPCSTKQQHSTSVVTG